MIEAIPSTFNKKRKKLGVLAYLVIFLKDFPNSNSIHNNIFN